MGAGAVWRSRNCRAGLSCCPGGSLAGRRSACLPAQQAQLPQRLGLGALQLPRPPLPWALPRPPAHCLHWPPALGHSLGSLRATSLRTALRLGTDPRPPASMLLWVWDRDHPKTRSAEKGWTGRAWKETRAHAEPEHPSQGSLPICVLVSVRRRTRPWASSRVSDEVPGSDSEPFRTTQTRWPHGEAKRPATHTHREHEKCIQCSQWWDYFFPLFANLH